MVDTCEDETPLSFAHNWVLLLVHITNLHFLGVMCLSIQGDGLLGISVCP